MEKIGLVRTRDGKSFLVPFILITSLFFLWGVAHSILDVLNKHFQDTLEITRTRSALIQAVVYGGYFIMALPAGRIIRRFGYRTGVLTGLVLYGIGALLFIPGGRIQSFEFFLLALFVIGCGLTCLETASNPYVTVLGEPEGSERRINLAQSFNGLGWICGPLAGGFFLFAGGGDVTTPYAVLGTVVLCIAILFSRVKLPEIGREAESEQAEASGKSLWRTTSFTVGLLSLFLYVAAQTGINSFFINYATENAGVSAQEASVWLSFGGMGLFMAGRMGGSWLMRFVKGEKVLNLIREKAKTVYPNIRIETYSPPYKPEFSEEENRAIIEAINRANPDLLWIGMTAPKQEKWAYRHWDKLDIHCHCGTIGAVFDFFAGTMERAPLWWQEHSLEWLYRLLKEPKRMWRRYIIGNTLFIWNIFREM